MKNLYLSLLLLISGACHAQETYFLKANFSRTPLKDSALLICTIEQKDPATGVYAFTQTFNTGEVYTSGKTTNAKNIIYDVEHTEFYLNGKPLRTTVYQDRKPVKITNYYPNGSIYLVKELSYPTDPAQPTEQRFLERILTCNARDGKALTVNGNGTYVTYLPPRNPKLAPERFSNEEDALFDFEQGPVADGLKNGTWTGVNDAAGLTYTEEFSNGRFVSGFSTDRQSVKHNYTQASKMPEYQMGIEGLYRFISSNVKYPASSYQKRTQGKVFVTFLVGLDGAVTDIGVLRSPDAAMTEEAIRVLTICPKWTPGERHGALVKQRYTVPISFTLDK